MSTPAVPSDLQLHLSQRTHPAFRGEGRSGGIRASRRASGFFEEQVVAEDGQLGISRQGLGSADLHQPRQSYETLNGHLASGSCVLDCGARSVVVLCGLRA